MQVKPKAMKQDGGHAAHHIGGHEMQQLKTVSCMHPVPRMLSLEANGKAWSSRILDGSMASHGMLATTEDEKKKQGNCYKLEINTSCMPVSMWHPLSMSHISM